MCIRDSLDVTPVNYIEWRFAGGMDREGAAKNFMELNEEEAELINQKHGQIAELLSRRKGKKGKEYEVCWFGVDPKILDGTTWMHEDLLRKFTWIDQADKKKKEAVSQGSEMSPETTYSGRSAFVLLATQLRLVE